MYAPAGWKLINSGRDIFEQHICEHLDPRNITTIRYIVVMMITSFTSFSLFPRFDLPFSSQYIDTAKPDINITVQSVGWSVCNLWNGLMNGLMEWNIKIQNSLLWRSCKYCLAIAHSLCLASALYPGPHTECSACGRGYV